MIKKKKKKSSVGRGRGSGWRPLASAKNCIIIGLTDWFR